MSRSDTARSKRPSRFLRIAGACVLLLAIAAYAATQYLTSRPGPARCIVRATDKKSGSYELKPRQAANAATISAVATQQRLPPRAVEIALATSMQESGLRNITHGDRDSLGLFQQRPSQGWGTEAQVVDPVHATGEFYNHLVQIPGYARLPLTVAAQQVQHSGYPEAYAKHERHASMLTSVLTGRRAAAFSCTSGPEGPDRQAGSPQLVRERLIRDFGSNVLSGSTERVPAQQSTSSTGATRNAGATSRTGTTDRTGSTGGSGGSTAAPAVKIPVRVAQHGWQLAHWAVANSAGLHISQVSYENRVWNASSSPHGWHEDGNATKGSSQSAATTVTVRLATGQ